MCKHPSTRPPPQTHHTPTTHAHTTHTATHTDTLALATLPPTHITPGAIFFSDIFLSLHIGFIATYNTRKLLVMNGRLVARQYLLSVGGVLAGSVWCALTLSGAAWCKCTGHRD